MSDSPPSRPKRISSIAAFCIDEDDFEVETSKNTGKSRVSLKEDVFTISEKYEFSDSDSPEPVKDDFEAKASIKSRPKTGSKKKVTVTSAKAKPSSKINSKPKAKSEESEEDSFELIADQNEDEAFGTGSKTKIYRKSEDDENFEVSVNTKSKKSVAKKNSVTPKLVSQRLSIANNRPKTSSSIEKVRIPGQLSGPRRVGLSKSAPTRPLSPSRDRESGLSEGQLDDVNSTNNSSYRNDNDNEVLLYCPESNAFGSTNSHEAEINNSKMGIPLKRKNFKWRQKERMSEEDLKLKRSIFWETCYTFGGQQQVWNALKLVCQEGSDDLQLFRSILESCGVILPFGQLTEIYDSKGFRYHLPPYCVCAPVLEKEHIKKRDENDVEGNKWEKVKIRLSDGKDFAVNLEEQESVFDIKRFIRNQENIDSKKRMVVLWCGRVLEDAVKLRSLNLPKGAVLQVMIP